MIKKLLTLIVLFFVLAAMLNTAYARRIKRNHKIKAAQTALKTDSVTADSLLQFAKNLIGTRYRSACSDPSIGFDCSGFVSYVFKSFNFSVPRSSPEFMDIGEKISLADAKPGDIIIFKSPTHKHRIGHVGIVLYNGADDFKFIHSTSGKERGVTITSMDDTYRRRFVQIVRVMKQHDNCVKTDPGLMSNIGFITPSF